MMPNFNRDLKKWRPFESLISQKEVLESLKNAKLAIKPDLFQEKKEEIANLVKEAYLNQSFIKLIYFHENKIKLIKTKIKNIYPEFNTLRLLNDKVIDFAQILDLVI